MNLTLASIHKYTSNLELNGMSTNTVRAYRADLEGLLAFTHDEIGLPDDALFDLGSVASRYLNELRLTCKPKTVQRKLGAFRGWAKFSGLVGFLAEYKPPKPHRPTPHPIPEGMPAVHGMMAAAPTDDFLSSCRTRALVALCGLAGLRVGEAVSAAPGDLNLAERTILVHGKGDIERIVPLSDAAWAAVLPAYALAVSSGGGTLVGVKDRRARQIITELGRAAGLSREISSHDLRATLATAAYESTGNLRAVQEILGHASSTTTEVYTGISERAKREAVNAASISQNRGAA